MGLSKGAAALSLSLLFAPLAATAQEQGPYLFDAPTSNRSFVVQGCTQDRALLEVQFDITVSPHFEATKLGSPDDPRYQAFQDEITAYFNETLQQQWRVTVAQMTLSAIVAGEQNALRPLLNGLYAYLDPQFNSDETYQNIDYVLPVLKGGQYAAQHPACL